MTYDELISEWSGSRVAVGDVMEYTARKDAQKARLLSGMLSKECDEIRKLDVIHEIGELRKAKSTETVRQSMKRGKSAFRWGRLMGLTTNDPFDGVPMPKRDGVERRSLSHDEARRLRQELDADGSEIATMALTALLTGMRYGEVLALRACDVQDGTITVRQAVKCDLTIGEPKTQSSRRKIAIPRSLEERLLRCGDGDLFSITYHQGQKEWARWRDDHGFIGLKFHELRHTHATMLIADGMDFKTVQHRLGHSSATVTMDVYAHAMPSKDVEAADRIERMMQ